MFEFMICLFDKGYGIDRTFGRLRERSFNVDYDTVACAYVEYHKRETRPLRDSLI